MITVKLQGRLGNHLFQIATAIAYALRYTEPFHIPAGDYFYHLMDKNFNPKFKRNIIQEKKHSFQQLPAPKRYHNNELHGYFQCEEYFKKYRTEILDLIGIKPVKTNAVAIHVRRGDYLLMPDKYIQLGVGYFNRGMDYFYKKGERNFVVFGDDPEWNQNNIKKDGCTFHFMNGTTMEDFYMMAGCKAHIISNSTYSWWAAWIADGEVIAPKEWFGKTNKHLEEHDIIPQRWIKL